MTFTLWCNLFPKIRSIRLATIKYEECSVDGILFIYAFIFDTVATLSNSFNQAIFTKA